MNNVYYTDLQELLYKHIEEAFNEMANEGGALPFYIGENFELYLAKMCIEAIKNIEECVIVTTEDAK